MEDDMFLVLCVCKGNIGRSPIMEAYLRKAINGHGRGGRIMVRSAGIMGTCGTREPRHVGPPTARVRNPLSRYPAWKHMEPLLELRGIDLGDHIFRPVDRALINRADLVLAADANVLAHDTSALVQQFPDAYPKMMLFSGLIKETTDIPDFGEDGGLEVCREAMRIMDGCVRNGLTNLFRQIGIVAW